MNTDEVIDKLVTRVSDLQTQVNEINRIEQYRSGDGAWTTLTINSGNGWAAFGGGEDVLAYRIDGKYVHLRGLIKNGTINTVCATLPAGARPSKRRRLLHRTVGGSGELDITTGGDIIPQTGNNSYISFDSIWFEL